MVVKQEEAKDTNLNIRISEDLRNLIRRAAKKSVIPNESEWIRRRLEKEAKRELAK